jgi:hypothetical protein
MVFLSTLITIGSRPRLFFLMKLEFLFKGYYRMQMAAERAMSLAVIAIDA